MRSKASIGGHPLHPMLILVPAGAFLLTLVCDLVYLATGDELWWQATKPIVLIGVIGALVAAVPGVIDLVSVVPRRRALAVGITHMVGNLIIVGLFVGNGWLRWTADAVPVADASYTGLWLTAIGNALLAFTGWLGGHLVYKHHVGVNEADEPHSYDRRLHRPYPGAEDRPVVVDRDDRLPPSGPTYH